MNAADLDWKLFPAFLAVLREGSLSAAARTLGLTQPTVARQIAALEAALGTTLFLRSQQGLAPTDMAAALGGYVGQVEATFAAMLREASGTGGVRGSVRISASEIIGAEVLPPILAELRRRHDGLRIELVLSNDIDNLLRREADIAVRMVEPAQEALLVRKLGQAVLGLHAHPRYLKRAGTPQDMAALAGHSLIGFDRETPAIRAMRKRAPAFDTAHFALRTDSDLAQLAAIRAGFGIGICQTALAAREPRLVRVLPGAFELRLGMWLAMHEDLRATPRCRAVFDALAEGLKAYAA